MTLHEHVDKLNQSLPSDAITIIMLLIGVAFISVALLSKNNLLKLTMIAYAVLP